MKAAVIGAGITGCAAALELSNRGYNVTLFDKSDRIGGSLIDLVHDGGFWFQACQYLAPNADWFKRLIPEDEFDFITFDHKYGSYSVYENEATFDQELALPVLKQSAPMLQKSLVTNVTLEDRFNVYGGKIATWLKELASRTGHSPTQLHHSCAASLQLSAVSFEEEVEQMLALKGASQNADALFALPRRVFGGEYAKLKAALPVNGYDKFFSRMEQLLTKIGVNLRLGVGVTARKSTDGFSAYLRREKLDADLLIWCCNPVPLIHAADLGWLDNPTSKFIHFHCLVDSVQLMNPFYVQCFDVKSPLYRIYVYSDGREMKACVECFVEPKVDDNTIYESANTVLQNFIPNARLIPKRKIPVTAHYLYSPSDLDKFKKFEVISKENNIIPGAWELFGRDQKIEKILALIQERI